MDTHYISNVIQNARLLPIAPASVTVGAPAQLGNKNSLAFASDIGSLVVIGRFRDLIDIDSKTDTAFNKDVTKVIMQA